MNQPQPSNMPEFFPDDLPRFRPGDRVDHLHFGYRGVVVDFDMSCHADEQWYHNNSTQPNRDQPWYHVLVHGTSGTTYVAQENLSHDASGQPVEHPLVGEFFGGVNDQRYVRNDAVWPPSWDI